MALSLDAGPVLEAALSGGGQMAELYLEESQGLAVVMDNGQVEKVIAGTDMGAGLRLIHNLSTVYAHANQMNQEGLLPLAKNLSSMAQGPKAALQAARPSQPGMAPKVLKSPGEAETRLKVKLVREAEAAARDLDPRIRQVRVTYMDRVQRVRIVNSEGVDASETRTYVVLAVHCVAQDQGVSQTGYETAGGLCGLEVFDERGPVQVAREAAKRAVLMLSADPAPGGSMPVVLSSTAGGTMIHEAVGHGLEADHAVENMTVYAGREGQQVASSLITVVDDATLSQKRGSYGFDDEGYPSQRNVLIDKGILTGWMHDWLSAHKMKQAQTGNGRRESYKYRPVPRMSNTMVLSGEEEPESIIRRTPSGLLVVKMGGGQVNPVNGDFVFEVPEGYLIKDGKIGTPVRGATLTGNGPEVLSQIDLVGNDLGFGIGTCGKDGQGAPVADAQPTLRIPSMVVGGVQA